MSLDERFLQAIIENPDDDAPRLVYADWLEERGDPRGEFIRVQCQLARLPDNDSARPAFVQREHDLLAAHEEQWVAPLRPLLFDQPLPTDEFCPPLMERAWQFRRGFVERVALRVSAFLERADEVFRLAPVRGVWFAFDQAEGEDVTGKDHAKLAGSPFFIMQASGYMSHNTGVFYILASLYCLLRKDRPQVFGVAGGLFFGLGANTRPLNMAALALPFGLLLLLPLLQRREEGRGPALRRAAAFMGGGLVMLAAMLAYNAAVTGDLLKSPYANDTAEPLGFTNGYTFDIGLRNQQAQVMALGLVINGLPGDLSLGLLFLPFLLGSRNRRDYFLLACAALPISAYLLYRYSGVYTGPRYWYETLPFLMLLSARGLELAGAFLAGFASAFLRQLAPSGRGPLVHASAGAAVACVTAVLIVAAGGGSWLLGWHSLEDAAEIPTRVEELEPLFEVDDRLADLADRTPLDNALVLVKPCGFFVSIHCYGSVFIRNDVDFDGDVVWARYVEGRNQEIIRAFPGRKVYVANWDGEASIEPYDPALER